MNKRIYLSPPFVDDVEKELLLEAFDSNWIAPVGPHINNFEKEIANYLCVNSACAMSSGTSALHIALELIGVKKMIEYYARVLRLSQLQMQSYIIRQSPFSLIHLQKHGY